MPTPIPMTIRSSIQRDTDDDPVVDSAEDAEESS
jgi:hypothetical protein